jgi:phosphotransferase system enzyme I (PtsI)
MGPWYDKTVTFDSTLGDSYTVPMKEFRGVPASPGIAIGRAFLYSDDDLTIPEYAIPDHQITVEMDRYRAAVGRAVLELEMIKVRTGPAGDPDGFLDTHLLMLQDPEIEAKIDMKIGKVLKNVEWVLQEVVDELVAKLATVQDNYLKERTLDIRDVSRRVLGHLLHRGGRPSLADLKEEVIVVTPSLLPSDAVAMNKKLVLGLAMDQGGATTHTAILARSFEIPAVLGTLRLTREVRPGDWLVVDGNEGVVLVNPEPAVLEAYRVKRQHYGEQNAKLQSLKALPAQTLDGRRLGLNANIEIPDEVEAVLAHGAEGIGLYRSEFLFIEHGVGVSEEIQYEAYRRVLEGMGERWVTIRTLDLGGDKLVPDLFAAREANPLLGWRAIRFCLSSPAIFHTQLRALLRASAHGNLKIMFPMISGVAELEHALEALKRAKDEVEAEGLPMAANIPVGTMIEVPSAALVSDHLAAMVDFFSIGTNDLTQYTLAVDRGNERIAGLYEPFHPGVLRLIRTVIDNAHAAGIPVAMCGEMASDPRAAIILLGLGLDEFSMNAVGLPKVKQVIRNLSSEEARSIAASVLTLKCSREIETALEAHTQGRFSRSESHV